jgi:hypothetical protein
MVIGYGIINLRIPESGSLKTKRSVLNRILKRVQNEFNVSIAETGRLDNYKFAEIAFAVVENDSLTTCKWQKFWIPKLKSWLFPALWT